MTLRVIIVLRYKNKYKCAQTLIIRQSQVNINLSPVLQNNSFNKLNPKKVIVNDRQLN